MQKWRTWKIEKREIEKWGNRGKLGKWIKWGTREMGKRENREMGQLEKLEKWGNRDNSRNGETAK